METGDRSDHLEKIVTQDKESDITALQIQDRMLPTRTIIRNIMTLAIPSVFQSFFQFFSEVINLIFVGHLNDPAKLAGVGMGNMILNVSTLSILMGLNGAADTLVSQSFGADNMRACGVYLNRGRLVLTISFIPMIFILHYSDRVLIGLGQDPLVAYYSRIYIVTLIPGMFFMGHFDLNKRFLNAMRKTYVPMIVQIFGTLLNAGLNYVFVVKFRWDIRGTSISTSIVYFFLWLLSTVYISCLKEIQEAVFWPDRTAFQKIGSYLKIAIPALLQLCLEWWCFEVLALISGLIGVIYQATQVLLFQVAALAYMFPFGMSSAASTLIGNSIGENNLPLTKRYYIWNIIIAASVNACVCVAFVLLRYQIMAMYTNEQEVVELAVNTIPYMMGTFQFFDMCNGVFNGITRGFGLQGRSTLLILFWFYVVALPMVYVFVFKLNLMLVGLWAGVGVGCFGMTLSNIAIIKFSDWKSIAREAYKRNLEDKDRFNQSKLQESVCDVEF